MTTPTAMSNTRFWCLTLGLLIVWAIVITTTTAEVAVARGGGVPAATSVPSKSIDLSKEADKRNTRNCKALCGHCGCIGFYCGEECICECNNENADTECIGVMQNNARKLRTPFELLIQGPAANRFVRNALQFEQNTDRILSSSPTLTARNRRSTVVIYKPAAQNSLDFEHSGKVSKKTVQQGRNKRSVSNLEWFSDFANTLVRPAPLIGSKQRAVDATTTPVQQKRSTARKELDRSWFNDNTNRQIKPAPLFKRQNNERVDDAKVIDTPVLNIGSQMIKDTIKNLKETALNEELVDAFKTTIRDGTVVLTDQIQNNFEFFPKAVNNVFEDTYTNLKAMRDDLPKPPPPPTDAPRVQPKFIIPWFRPVRFLQRVQQAIN